MGLLPFEQSKGESFLLCRTAGSHRLGGQSGAKAVLCYQLRLNVTSQTHKNTAIYVSGLRRPVHTAAAASCKDSSRILSGDHRGYGRDSGREPGRARWSRREEEDEAQLLA